MSNEKIKSGKEIVDDFFSNLENDEQVNCVIKEKIISLYKESKFTDTNIINALSKLREEARKDEQN